MYVLSRSRSSTSAGRPNLPAGAGRARGTPYGDPDPPSRGGGHEMDGFSDDARRAQDLRRCERGRAVARVPQDGRGEGRGSPGTR